MDFDRDLPQYIPERRQSIAHSDIDTSIASPKLLELYNDLLDGLEFDEILARYDGTVIEELESVVNSGLGVNQCDVQRIVAFSRGE
jgi:hypothetical protein